MDVIRTAFGAGIRSFDFADGYDTEHLWADALAQVEGLREGAVLCTKVGIRWDPHRYDHSHDLAIGLPQGTTPC